MMLTENRRVRKYITLSAVLGFIAFLMYLFLFTNFTDVEKVIGGTNMELYVLAFVFVVVSSGFDAMTWKSTLDGLSVKTTFKRIFSLTWVGHFVDTLVPGGLSGDAFKAYMLTKDKGVNGPKAVASIIIKDVLELVVVLSSLIVGVVLLAFDYSVNNAVMTAIGIMMVFLTLPLVCVLYFSLNVGATEKLLRAIDRLLAKIKRKDASSAAIKEKVHSQITEFREGLLSIKKNPKMVARPLFFQVFCWLFEVLSLFVVFIALGSFIGFDKVVITNSIISNVQGQGVALAGFSQIVSGGLYEALGITAGIAIASSLLAGFSGFWFKLMLSFGFFQVTVFERCIPFLCAKCGGWRSWRTKSCPEPKPKKLKSPIVSHG
jgi:uncharacterized protein (TIRG00374 family)